MWRQALSYIFRDWACHIILGPLLLSGLGQASVRESPNGRVGIPVLLVPGYAMNRGVMRLFEFWLRRSGWRWVLAMNHRPRSAPIPELARHLSQEVERLCQRSGASQVDIVAHSMGGLVASWYLMHLEGDRRVRRFITVGTPFEGTRTWIFAPGRQGLDMRPGSDFLRSLGSERPSRLVLALWSARDYIVLPSESARACGREQELEWMSHMEIHFSATVFGRVADALLNPEPQQDQESLGEA